MSKEYNGRNTPSGGDLDLLEAIDPERKLDYTDYCSAHKYRDWEIKVAIPALKDAGYSIQQINFQTLEGDSFGPLTRGIIVMKNGVRYMARYG